MLEQTSWPSTTALQIAALLKERSETVAVAEGSAGGLVSASILAVPGASADYVGAGSATSARVERCRPTVHRGAAPAGNRWWTSTRPRRPRCG